LLEVLIAVLVMAIGLLGLAALQASTLQFNRGAYLRSQATSFGYDMADRMRANREAALAGAYNADFADPPPVCTAAVAGDSVAERDVSAWLRAIACALPQGNGSIEVEDGVVTISVSWNERGEGEDESFEMTTGL